ncbi:ABC transporter permease subunit [Kitasatospora sp. NPDC101183]|uniref:ABC transporter permease subunit n=1 Tax=Kitasatospora sp. NPDC101183 TaxID=3364100 RepID=UPI00380781E7
MSTVDANEPGTIVGRTNAQETNAREPNARGAGLAGAVAGEWIKLRSVRATPLSAAVALAAALFIGLIDYGSAADHWDTWTAAERARFDPVRYGFSGGFYIAVLAMGTLGTLAASSEYGTGQIRSTLAAVPRRGRLLLAKALVVVAAAGLFGQVLAVLTFLLGMRAIDGKHLAVSFGAPGVARAVIGCGFFLAAFALIGLALGFVLRHTAGALALLFGLFFLSPMLLEPFGDEASRYGLQGVFEGLGTTVTGAGGAERLAPTACFLTLAGYLAVALALAAVSLRRRDA